CHIRAYPTPTRLPDLHPLHLRSHNLPLPFRYSPSVLATHLLLTSSTPSPSAPILISDRTPPLSPPSYYSTPPSQHLHPPVILLCFPRPLRYSPSDLTTLLTFPLCYSSATLPPSYDLPPLSRTSHSDTARTLLRASVIVPTSDFDSTSVLVHCIGDLILRKHHCQYPSDFQPRLRHPRRL
ncbi:uncharacterized protein EI90DRAFT_3060629, partial [Cantharellus anzutake]|uniref:uncharacterized protein n=1 Tax=Cantharellus anzutake TaxID=1750568 RepID=UPI0019067AE4